MYYYLSGALRRRLILELQDSFSRHQAYRKLVPCIQNKFSFDERPQFGIVVKSSSSNKVQFSPDNFLGVIQSHVMLAYVGPPSFPLEWIREDLACVRSHGAMPTAPGVYYLEVLCAPKNAGGVGYFAIDPLLNVDEEPVFQTMGVAAQLAHIPVQKTLRVYQNRNSLLEEGTDYTVDYGSGHLQFTRSAPGATFCADYRYAAPSLGPIEFRWNATDTTALPGVVLAFGKRAQVGDKVAVVVYPDRVDAAHAFGGKFEVSFELDVIARDPTQMEEIADLCVMYLWAHKKPILEFEGIEIMDVSAGGENEELYDETADDYFYQASLSVQMRADWEIHVPLPLTISNAVPKTQAVASQLFLSTHPAVIHRNSDFERIG